MVRSDEGPRLLAFFLLLNLTAGDGFEGEGHLEMVEYTT